MELLLLSKAVAVAVWAPDMVLPSPTLPGVSGLLCSYVAITTSLCSSLVTGLCMFQDRCRCVYVCTSSWSVGGVPEAVCATAITIWCNLVCVNQLTLPCFSAAATQLLHPDPPDPVLVCASGMLMRWLMTQRGLNPPSSKADEEQPLLPSSWEDPENNKDPHKPGSSSTAGAGGAGASSGSSAGSSDGPVIQQGTVLELLRLSVPDTPLLLVAFVFGSAAALMSACVPYFTGLIIDFASIDPDRLVSQSVRVVCGWGCIESGGVC